MLTQESLVDRIYSVLSHSSSKGTYAEFVTQNFLEVDGLPAGAELHFSAMAFLSSV
jgi:hypothetical protein